MGQLILVPTCLGREAQEAQALPMENWPDLCPPHWQAGVQDPWAKLTLVARSPEDKECPLLAWAPSCTWPRQQGKGPVTMK